MDGTDELSKLALDLAGAESKTVVMASRAIRKAALDIEAHAKAKAPVDTGALRGSISTTVANTGLEAEIGPTVHYGLYVELGTARMAPQPYMGPAADTVEPSLVEALAQIGVGILDPS